MHTNLRRLNSRVSNPARLFLVAALITLSTLAAPASAAAQSPHQLCDPAETDCRAILIDRIRAETVRLDVAFWFMEDHWVADEIIARWNAGVPVRILMDTEANSPNPLNIQRLASFQAAGIPMRERTASGILHWKMMIFGGQNLVEFSGANYSSDAWLPQTPTLYQNYVDEVITFTSDPSLVASFKSKYDDLWTNTTSYTNYRNVTGTPARAYPSVSTFDERLNFVPDVSHYSRAAAEYRREPSAIDVIMYRITDSRFTDEMIAAKNRGVTVRLMTEPQQYRDVRRLWHSYNVDVLYMNGIDIRHRVHAGLNHQKSVLLRGLGTAIYGSSNWSAASAEYQEEHNLFTQDPAIYDWLVNQFERKWNNSTGVAEYGPFTPLPPDQAVTPSPAAGAASVPVDNAILAWDAGPWAHRYDVYLGTNGSALSPIATDVYLGPSQWTGDFKSVVVPGSLLPGTTYYWRVVSRTMANKETTSPLWSFSTAGSATPPPSSATVVRQPYLQQVTSTGATVVWATREGGAAQLRVSTSGGTTVTANAASVLVPASATGLSGDYYQHVARVEGLSPSTTYQYDILLGGGDLNPSVDTLRTAPPIGAGAVSFVAFGDSGTGSTQQQQIAAMLAGENADFAMHGGDIAYGNSGGTGPASYQTMDNWFFSMYASWLRSRPMFPSIGNHDSRAENANGRPYLDLFVLPTHGATTTYPDHAERYYSFDYGPVHVVVLDTELAFQDTARRAAQIAWLRADLGATTQPWKVALFHRSPYSAGGEHGSDLTVREAFGAVFDEFGVQLAISAHEHDYERTVPMRAGVPAAGGTTYLVTGGGGAPLYPAATGTWTAYSASVHHYLKGTATACTLRIDAISISGGALDAVELTRCTAPPPLPAPWTSRDIGAVGPAGSASESGGTFTVKGAGADIWNAADAFHYVSQPIGGDFDVQARVTSIEFVQNWVKAGVMIRETLTPDSAHGMMLVSPGKGLAFQRRVATGGLSTSTSGGAGAAPNWVKLERRGNTLTAYRSADGTTWTLVGSDTFTMGANVYVGLMVSSHDSTRTATATFDNVSVTPVGGPPQNEPPTVVIATPVEGATFTAPASIGIQANAVDSDGTIARADFYAGSTLLGSDTSAPFQWTWTGVAAGTYTLTVRATDNDGAETTSEPVVITVNAPAPNAPPSVGITAPASGATFTAPATIAIAANASDTDGTIARVDFYNGATLLGSDTSAPYQWSWTGVAAGTYSLTARAIDDDGAQTTSAAVSVTVNNSTGGNPPPSVSLTSPAAGSTFPLSSKIAIAAVASDSNGTVQRVEFYAGSTLLGTDASSPYGLTWKGPPAGTYTLTARAIDNGGAQTTSAPVTITVGSGGSNASPSVSITSPASGATFAAPATIAIAANASDTDGTVARVDFYNGSTLLGSDTSAPYQWSWTGVAAGTYTLTARATDDDGAQTTSASVSVSVNNPASNASPSVAITGPAAGATFIAPATIAIAANASDTDGTVARVDFYNGATLLGSDTSAPYQWSWTGVAAGTYTVTARATDDDGAQTTSASVSVSVNNPASNASPSVAITGPAAGATFTAPATIAIAASASDTDGTVARVDFYNGATLLGSDTSAPYQWSWTGVAEGTYTLTARATDDDGAQTTSAAISITVNDPAPPSGGLPAPWSSQDIGNVGPAGSATFSNGTFTVKGAGADIWYYSDAFHYVWRPMTGNVDVIARVTSTDTFQAWVKGAVMIREQLTPESAHAMMLVSPGKGLAFQRRVTTWGASTNTSGGAGTAPAWVKLERRGNVITAYRSDDGVTWTLVGSDTFSMAATVYVGLAVTSHDASRLATVTFDNVSVIQR